MYAGTGLVPPPLFFDASDANSFAATISHGQWLVNVRATLTAAQAVPAISPMPCS